MEKNKLWVRVVALVAAVMIGLSAVLPFIMSY